ncbi:helix-turn-helix transcriptional regulator [Wenyingzhuangia sp. IMCC45533]
MTEKTNPINELVGQNIRRIRKTKKLGQSELSSLTTVSRPTISNIEAGKFNLTISTLFDIAIALECKVEDIIPTLEDYYALTNEVSEEYHQIIKSASKNISKRDLSIIKGYL